MSLQETPPHALDSENSHSTNNSSTQSQNTTTTTDNTKRHKDKTKNPHNIRDHSNIHSNNDKNDLCYSASDSESEEIALRPSSTITQNKQLSRKSLNPAWGKIFRYKTTGEKTTNSTTNMKRFIQPKLRAHNMDNVHFGDTIQKNHSNVETILFQNINGIKDDSNWNQIIHTMKELDIDIFGFAETNKSMDNFSKQRWISTIQKQYYLSRSVTSESNIKTDNDYKPGGTITTVTGKWQARISEMGQDKKGLGRWSYIKISSRKANLIIITAYRPCKASGPMTSWMQQWSLLRESGIKSPDPIKWFYQDLSAELQAWTNKGYEILLMMDANEHIGEKPGGIGKIVSTFKLTDLILYKHPEKEIPNTYAENGELTTYSELLK
jgi:hypothetical protein